MREVLLSLPGFTASKIRNIHNRNNKNNKKLSAAAAVQLAYEGCIDIDSPDSILGQVNLRSLLNKSTFQKLPASFQFKLMHLLPQVEIISDEKPKNIK
jgi:additional sex combs-like protein